jgi:hypothetical protein
LFSTEIKKRGVDNCREARSKSSDRSQLTYITNEEEKEKRSKEERAIIKEGKKVRV